MEKIGKYEVLEEVGKGGFGVVYKGRDPFIRRLVAIKTCSSESQEIRQRFFREAQIAGNLHHPNVVTIHDFGVEDETPYIVQEYLKGEDLDQKIKGRKPLTFEDKLHILLGIAEGLGYAHSKGVIHRDIKPANIRITHDNSIKVMDFGIAKLSHVKSHLTQTGTTLGTVTYLSPEQLKGGEVDQRCDIFSFGVLAYELFAYQRPFDGESVSQVFYEILHGEPRDLAELVPNCPARLKTIVARCLAKEPEERFGNFGQVTSELNLTLGELDQDTLQLTTTHEITAPPTAVIDTDSQKEAEKLAREGGLPADLPSDADIDRMRRLADRAREAVEAGDLTAAEVSIDMARREHSDTIVFHDLFDPLIEQLSGLRQVREAEIRKAEQALLHFEDARRRLDEGELDAAIAAVDQCLELAPDHPEAGNLRQSILEQQEQQRQEREREEALRQAIAEIENRIESSDAAGAEQGLDDARQRFGDREPRLASLAGRIEELERRIESAELGRRARDLLKQGDVDAAREAIEAGLALAPGDRGLEKIHGDVEAALEARRREQERREEIDSERRAIEELVAAGELSAATSRLSKTLRRLGDDEALTDLATRIDQAKRDRRVRELRESATAAIDAGKLEEARTALDEALELAANEPSLGQLEESWKAAVAERQRAADRQRDLEQARAAAEEAIRDRDVERAAAILAEASQRLGEAAAWPDLHQRLDETRTAARREALLEEVGAHLDAADLDQARQALENARQLGADDRLEDLTGRLQTLERQREVESLGRKAQERLDAGEPAEARELLQRALELEPSAEPIERLLAEAEQAIARQKEEERRRRAYEQALSELEGALERGELDATEALLERTREELGDSGALKELSEQLERARREQRVAEALEAAQRLVDGDELGEARKLLKSVQELAPDAVAPRLAEIEKRIADRRERERVRKLVAETEESVRAALEAEDLERASRLLSDAETEIGDASPLAQLAEQLERARRRAEAARLFSEAEEALASESWQDALSRFEGALELDPDLTEARELAQEARRRLREAEEERRRAEEERRRVQAFEASLAEAEAALERGRVKPARRALETARGLGDDPRLAKLAERVERTQQEAAERSRARRPYILGAVAAAAALALAVVLVPPLFEGSDDEPASTETAALGEGLAEGFPDRGDSGTVPDPAETAPPREPRPPETDPDRSEPTASATRDESEPPDRQRQSTEPETAEPTPPRREPDTPPRQERLADASTAEPEDRGPAREREQPSASEPAESPPTRTAEPERTTTPVQNERADAAPEATRQEPRQSVAEPPPERRTVQQQDEAPQTRPTERPTPRQQSSESATSPPPPPAGPDPAVERQQIMSVLRQYEGAYEALDAAAVAAVYPGIDRGALADSFANLRSYDMTIDYGSCSFDLATDRATVRCPVSREIRARVGGALPRQSGTTTFGLQKTGSQWRIVQKDES